MAPLALSPASPAMALSGYLGTSPVQQASGTFSPPAGSVIFVTAYAGDAYHGDWDTGYPVITDSLAAHLPWSRVGSAYSNSLTSVSRRVTVWQAYAAAAPGPMTVSVTEKASGGQYLTYAAVAVDIWANASPGTGALVITGASAPAALLSAAITPHAAGSALMLACAAGGTAQAVSAGAGDYARNAGNADISSLSEWIGTAAGPALTADTAQKTLTAAVPSARTWQYVAYEVLAAVSYTLTATVTDPVTARAGTGTGVFTVAGSAGSLPAGLSLSAAGVLSGTPAAAGTYSFTVRVTDSAGGTATLALGITVAPASP